jgi:hypothetical protein
LSDAGFSVAFLWLFFPLFPAPFYDKAMLKSAKECQVSVTDSERFVLGRCEAEDF